MPRAALIPSELSGRPFHFTEAREFGITKHHLVGQTWLRLGGGYYALRAVGNQPLVRLAAIMHRLPADAVFSGPTAAWLNDFDLARYEPIEVSLPESNRIAHLKGITIHRTHLTPVEIVRRKGMRTTSPLRTVCDLARRADIIEAVAILDRALHRRLMNTDELRRWCDCHRGHRGIARLHRAIGLADGDAESVMETRLRLLLVLAGLPRPRVQVTLRDDEGQFLGRPDLFYPGHNLAIEYDGATHRSSLVTDDRRQNRLVDAGFHLLRFTAGDVLNTPLAVVALVRRALARPALRS